MKSLEELETEYFESVVEGVYPDLWEWCQKYPEHRVELVDFVLEFWPIYNGMRRIDGLPPDEGYLVSLAGIFM